MIARRNKNNGHKATYKFWLVFVGITAAIFFWFYLDAPVSEEVVVGVITQGVWKVQRHSNATYKGVARIEDGTLVNFTTYRSLPVGANVQFYRYRRPISSFTTYEYAGP